jgi:hypothetical protein
MSNTLDFLKLHNRFEGLCDVNVFLKYVFPMLHVRSMGGLCVCFCIFVLVFI